MRRLAVTVVGLCSALIISSNANASTIVVNFDDLTGSGTVPDGYGGITWGGVWQYYDSFQPPYTAHSPSTRIFNVPRTSDQPFTFSSDVAFLGGWFAGSAGFAEVGFDLYNTGVLVSSTPRTFISDVPLFLASGYAGLIDEVRVYSSQGDFYILDDVTYSTDASVPVPEPVSLALLGTGLAGVGFRRWRRRQHS